MTRRTAPGVALALAVLFGTATAADRGTVYDTLAAEDRNTVMAVAVKEAGGAAALRGKDEYTLFAPTDAAFRKLDDKAIGRVAADKKVVKELFAAHLVKGNYPVAALKKRKGTSLTTVGGAELKVEERADALPTHRPLRRPGTPRRGSPAPGCPPPRESSPAPSA